MFPRPTRRTSPNDDSGDVNVLPEPLQAFDPGVHVCCRKLPARRVTGSANQAPTSRVSTPLQLVLHVPDDLAIAASCETARRIGSARWRAGDRVGGARESYPL